MKNNPQPGTSRSRPGERGSSLVEMALIFPVLLLLALGTMDIGMGFRTYIGLTNAAREGARWLSAHPDDVDGALARVSEEAGRLGLSVGAISDGGVAVAISPQRSSYSAGERITVTVQYDYPLLFGSFTGLPTVPFRIGATMVVLYDGS